MGFRICKIYEQKWVDKVGDGRVDPKGTTTREQAVIMVVRTYEKYEK